MSILHVWQRYRHLHMAYSVAWLLLMALPIVVHAEQFTGRVVGIADGDTISVLREGKAVKVRLHGVDTPEKAQAYGTQARKLTSDMAFQQVVAVVIRATDRYGRLVVSTIRPQRDDPRPTRSRGPDSQARSLG